MSRSAGQGPVVASKSEIAGVGVFVREAFATGSVVLKADGVVTRQRSVSSFQISPHKHLETASIARLVNHSCEPNCQLLLDGETRILLLALQDLHPGTEVTVDYSTFESERSDGPIECACRSLRCRGTIVGYNDLTEDQQGALAPYLLPYLRT
jgi:uncharacterized protein